MRSMSASEMPTRFICAIAVSRPSGWIMFPVWPRSEETIRLFAPICLIASATVFASVTVQWRIHSIGALGPTMNCRKQISISAPIPATCFASSIDRPGMLVKPCATTIHAMHPLDCRRVDAAHRIVKHDAAPDLDPRYDFHHERRSISGISDVILQHDAAHAARFRELRDVDVVHVAAEHIGMRVHV